MKADYTGDNWAVYNADCIEALAGMPEGSIDLSIFSPPFSDLFVYSDSERDIGQLLLARRVYGALQILL
jgi:hypothetical protein